MIRLLYTVIFTEAAAIMSMLFKTPLRKIVISGLDRVKTGRGPIVAKTIGGTVILLLMSSVYSVMKIRKHWMNDGNISATDQVLMSQHLLEASLMGFFLFLALMLDRLHHYIREIRLRREMEAVKKSNGKAEEIKAREEQVGTFKQMIQQMESELRSKAKEADAAESIILSLRKQSEGLLLEYDRLLAENQELRAELQSLDRRYVQAPLKKNS